MEYRTKRYGCHARGTTETIMRIPRRLMSEDYYQATRLTMAWERTKRRRERRRKRRVAKMFRVQLGCTKQEFNRLGFSAWVMGKKALYDRAEIQLERDY